MYKRQVEGQVAQAQFQLAADVVEGLLGGLGLLRGGVGQEQLAEVGLRVHGPGHRVLGGAQLGEAVPEEHLGLREAAPVDRIGLVQARPHLHRGTGQIAGPLTGGPLHGTRAVGVYKRQATLRG